MTSVPQAGHESPQHAIAEKAASPPDSTETITTSNANDDKSMTKKKALHRRHSRSSGLSVKSRDDSLTASPSEKAKSSTLLSPELKTDALNAEASLSPSLASISLAKGTSGNASVLEHSNESTISSVSSAALITASESDMNSIEYWKQRCAKLMQELQEVRAENRAMQEKIRQQELLIEKFILKTTPKKELSDIYTKIPLAQFKRTSHPPIMNKSDLDERTYVAIEIFTTEQSYVTSLDIVINVQTAGLSSFIPLATNNKETLTYGRTFRII